MPSCSIKGCASRKTKNQPNLTVHRFPKNEVLRRKWLDAIGQFNTKSRHKELYICSLHFEESQFNRTLEVTRLRDNAVPTLFNMVTAVPSMHQKKVFLAPAHDMPSTSKNVPILHETGNIQENVAPKNYFSPACVMPSTSKDVPVLYKTDTQITNIQPKDDLRLAQTQVTVVPSMEQRKEFLAPAHDTISTSKNIPILHEIGNIQKHVTPKHYLSPACEMPSTSKDVSVLYKTDIQMKNIQPKKNLRPAQKQVGRQVSRLEKLQNMCNEQKKKIKRLNEKIRRQGKKIANLEDILKDLKKKMIVNTEQCMLLEHCAGSQDFLKRQIAKTKGLPLEKKYSEEIRKFALTLNFLSPKAYDYVRKVYNTCLPHSRTLSKWYQSVNAEAGFTKEAFDSLKIKVEQSGSEKILCALVFDEMAIRKGLTWDPKSQKYQGRVDCGKLIESDSAAEANQCLVLLLTCINGSWKLPIGYFLITSLTGDQKSLIVQTALKLTEETGARVVSVTCDGPASNFSMFSALGCDLNKNQNCTSFETENKNNVYAFIDPCHAIKLVRNTFGDLKVLTDGHGRKIDFKYLELLLNLQERQGLHLGTKLSKAHIFYEKQKMKVRLATQLLSNSVADAILYCKTELRLEEFKDCEGTVNFINIINNVFDILNSHSIRPPGLKKAMCPENIGLIRAFFESAIDYLRLLRLPSGDLVIESRRKTGFVGLIVDMKNAVNLYDEVVEKQQLLKYIPIYKLSQDHLELFFSSIRSRGGFNNNPNAVQFRAAYKRLLIRAEIRDGGIGNCIPLEQINILTCSSKEPVHSINKLTEKNSFVEIEEDHSNLYDQYIEAMSNAISKYDDSVLEYIAGFVCRKLSKTLKCDVCLSLLSGPVNVKSLIYLKSRGGLTYASADVISIIKKAEKLLKIHLESKKNPEHYYLYIFQFMVEYYNIDNEKILSTDTGHDTTHRLLLIKSIIKAFIDLRFRYHGKKVTEKLSYRNYFNKLILFRNE